jgi:hypothetical protein
MPLNEVHFFMDASAKRHGGGHRLIRHSYNTARFMRDYYGQLAPDLAHQAFLEVIVHIAFDAGVIHQTDVKLMSEYTRILSGKGGPRKLLTRQHGDRDDKHQSPRMVAESTRDGSE